MEGTTSSWASRRKAVYFWSIVLSATLISFLILWKYWYSAPTCFDGFQNGDEIGIDCGGSCSLVCSLGALPPVLRSDPRVFKVVDNVYSVLAFVENHNLNFQAPYLPYKFKIYDPESKLLYEREGATLLPKNQTISIFEGNLLISKGNPKRAEIEFGQNIRWTKDLNKDLEIEIESSPLLLETKSPRIEATVENKSIENIKNIELVAVVFDGRDNAIAASRTFIESLKKNTTAPIFFTWPQPFALGEVACEKPSDIVLAIDRSGSMASLGKDPPEPLTSVKTAAEAFVSELKESDSAGLLSFATEASNPPDTTLTNNFIALKTDILGLKIKEGNTQYTNIADAVFKSFDLLALKNNSEGSSQKIIILLTDGVATRPADPKGSRTEAEEIAYAESAAISAAALAKQNRVAIYTIGLGKDIHQDFLRTISSSPDSYFQAPSTSTLRDIYSKISSSICKEVPARIEITYKILSI